MAITGSYNFDGITVPNAYGRIADFTIREKFTTNAYLALYVSVEYAAQSGAQFRGVFFPFVYDPAAPESLNAQAYAAAKQLPQFAGWTDC